MKRCKGKTVILDRSGGTTRGRALIQAELRLFLKHVLSLTD